MVILDTNVLSELMSGRPNTAVMAWANNQRRDQLVTTAINVMELHSGIQLLPAGRRRAELAERLDLALDQLMDGRVVNFDRKAAIAAAQWYAKCRAAGRKTGVRDTQIAGIALARRIPIATRNIAHFEGLSVRVIDPWLYAA